MSAPRPRARHAALTAQPPPRRRPAAASGDDGAGPSGAAAGDSDALFLLKLLAVSFSTAAAVKYGSLLIDAPFRPEAGAAAALVLAPPLALGAWMATRPPDEAR